MAEKKIFSKRSTTTPTTEIIKNKNDWQKLGYLS